MSDHPKGPTWIGHLARAEKAEADLAALQAHVENAEVEHAAALIRVRDAMQRSARRTTAAEADLTALRAGVADVIAKCEARVTSPGRRTHDFDLGEAFGVDTVAAWLREIEEADRG